MPASTIDPTALTRQQAEEAVGAPIDRWDANCHAVSLALGPLCGGRVRRGYFTGRTTPGAHFHGRPSQHSWIELADGRVCDPTRSAFTRCARWPLWVGTDEEYDVGGCRSARAAGAPPDVYESGLPLVELSISSTDYVAGLIGTPSDLYGDSMDDAGDGSALGSLLEPAGGWLMASVEQVMWLANLPVREEERQGTLNRFFAAEVYEAIVAAGHGAFIPVDRRDWILEDGGEMYGG